MRLTGSDTQDQVKYNERTDKMQADFIDRGFLLIPLPIKMNAVFATETLVKAQRFLDHFIVPR